MLVIRRAQQQVLAEATRPTFAENVAAHLREVWPEATREMDAETLRAWVSWGVERGARYELVTEYEVGLFLDLTWALGTSFDENDAFPWAREILTDPALDGRRRIDALAARTQQVLGEMAEAISEGSGDGLVG